MEVFEIVSEYGIARSTIFKWIADYSNIGSFKAKDNRSKEDNVNNELNKDFNNRNSNEVIVSDLTYVKVEGKLHYICVLVHLFNREIIGCSAGARKEFKLVLEAFSKVKIPLNNIKILHTDRDSELKNKAVDDILSTSNIKGSLSKKKGVLMTMLLLKLL